MEHQGIPQRGLALFTDETRGRVADELRRQDNKLFAPILTPDLVFQAAWLSGLRIARAPLNLINLVWLALGTARHPEESFASLLGLPRKALRDDEHFPASDLRHLLDDALAGDDLDWGSEDDDPEAD